MRSNGCVAAVVAAFAGLLTASAFAIGIGDAEVVGVYMFDKDDGAVVSDASNAGNNGDIVGDVTWEATGKFGGSLLFEGGGSWVTVPDSPSLGFEKGADFTVATWFKTEMAAGDPPMIIGKTYQPAEARPWWALYYANGGKALDGSASLFLRDTAGTNGFIFGGPKVNDGQWHHIAGTREGATIYFYVD
ncbi:MAG: hypothetical protein O3A46_10575, partial [Candidatus Poribacteria bacterium]|nr:hypothetical protein [Candidatus Poribacteria bacterium]